MKELSRRRFLKLSGKALAAGAIMLRAIPGAGTASDSDVHKAADEQAHANLQSHRLPDFEAWMLSTAKAHL